MACARRQLDLTIFSTREHNICQRRAKIRPAYLRQLEDILFAVNDLQAATRKPCAHVPGVQPALLVQALPGLLLILEVSLEDVGASHTDLHTDLPVMSVS